MKLVKIRTVLVAGVAGGVGYVLGTKAGNTRYEQLKVQADRLRTQATKVAHSPQVHETVSNVAAKVKESAGNLPDPVADAVTKIADTATDATGPDETQPVATDPIGTDPLATDPLGSDVPATDPFATEPESRPGV